MASITTVQPYVVKKMGWFAILGATPPVPQKIRFFYTWTEIQKLSMLSLWVLQVVLLPHPSRKTGEIYPLIKSYKQTSPCHNSRDGLFRWLIPIHTYCLITIMCSCGENSGGRGEWGVGVEGRVVLVRGWGKEGGLRSERQVNNKWPRPHLIWSDFNPMFHHS